MQISAKNFAVAVTLLLCMAQVCQTAGKVAAPEMSTFSAFVSNHQGGIGGAVSAAMKIGAKLAKSPATKSVLKGVVKTGAKTVAKQGAKQAINHVAKPSNKAPVESDDQN